MTVELIQRTEEWLEFRKKGIGASDAPVIMGVSPWKTPYELFLEKLDLKDPPVVNYVDKEEEARRCFENHIGFEMPAKVLIHPEIKWMFASLDGFNIDKKVLLEIKCPGEKDHNFVKYNKVIPEKYYPQLQHQMEVVGVDKCYYFSYINDQDNEILEINRDEHYIKNLIKKECDFFHCIENLISPELTNKDYVFIDNPMWDQTVKEWLKINQYIKKEKELRDILISLSDGRSCRGSGVKLQKYIRKGNVDYSKIEVLKDIDLDKYRKAPSECWKLIEE